MKKGKSTQTIITFMLLPFSVLLFVASAAYPPVVERVYSRGIYPHLSSFLSRLTGVLPFSLAEFLVYGAVVYLVFIFFRAIVRLVRRRVRVRTQLWRFVKGIFLVPGLVYFSFIMLWGLNNNRLTLDRIAGYNTADITMNELEQCIAIMAKGARREAGLVARDEHGIMKSGSGSDEVRAVMDAVARLYHGVPLAAGRYGPPKNYYFSSILSRMGTAGFYFPFTGEVTINALMPEVSRPFVMAHEMAHQRGVARENEANFIAYRACASSGSPELRYSARVSALIYLLGKFKKDDPAFYEKMRRKLDRRILADMDNNRDFWQSHRGRVRDVFSAWNDLFLRASNQKDGSKSYGRFTDLLVAAMRKGEL